MLFVELWIGHSKLFINIYTVKCLICILNLVSCGGIRWVRENGVVSCRYSNVPTSKLKLVNW